MLLDMEKLSLDSSLPQRPGYGTLGRPIQLWANYFAMTADKSKLDLRRYAVNVLPQGNVTPAGKKLKRIVELLIEDHFAAHKRDIVSDYKSNIISMVELPNLPSPINVIYRGEGEDAPQQDPRVYQVKMVQLTSVSVNELVTYLKATSPTTVFGGKQAALAALNLVLGQYPKSADDVFSVGANKHYPMTGQPYNLQGGLDALRGFFVSVRAATGRLLLNVQVKHVACYHAGSLTNLINAYGVAPLPRLGKFLARLRVRATHIRRVNSKGELIPRFKTISGLAGTHDGRSLSHPPMVPSNGAGPADVKFWLDSDTSAPKPGATPATKGKGKGSAPAKAASAGGRYISVQDFFKQRKSNLSKSLSY